MSGQQQNTTRSNGNRFNKLVIAYMKHEALFSPEEREGLDPSGDRFVPDVNTRQTEASCFYIAFTV